MSDDDGTRLRNVSPYGEVDVPDIGQIVPFHHEIVLADAALAQRLVDSGHFTEVSKPGPKTTTPATADTTAPAPEEPTDDHAA